MDNNIVRRAVITKAGTDDKGFPVQQVTYLGKAADCEMIGPYGHHANLPTGDVSLSVIFGVDGQEDYRLCFGYTPTLRPKGLAEGEVVFYHPLTQTKMHYRSNGDIDIDVTGDNGDFNITVKKDLTVIIGGDATITVAGDAAINIDGTATVVCPTTNWTGDFNLDGDFDVTGATSLSSTVTSNGKDISDTHKHVGSATAPSGPIVNTGNPI